MVRSPGPARSGTLGEELAVAAALVEAAGPIALRFFRRPLPVEDKSRGTGFDPVTRADREIEASIRAELRRRFPEDGVLGEEEGAWQPDAPRCWWIDPIYGTRAFITGVPAWGILLGLVEEGCARLGVLHQPFLGETFLAGPEGTKLRDRSGERRLRTRAQADLPSAALYCTHPSLFGTESQRRAFERVAAASRMMRYGGDCYSYALLAMGQIDLVVESGLHPYDIIPLIPIVEGAGGVVSDWQGRAVLGGGQVVAAANRSLHRQVLELLGPES